MSRPWSRSEIVEDLEGAVSGTWLYTGMLPTLQGSTSRRTSST
jgi:hypothetical protein